MYRLQPNETSRKKRSESRCKYCSCDILIARGKAELNKHSTTGKHLKSMSLPTALLPVKEATGAALFTLIDDFLKKHIIPYETNLIGFAADGANNMMGAHNSLASRLREKCPNLFMMKCVCHSFHLCASYACEKLPSEVEQLARDVYNFFSNSPKRLDNYEEFQEFANVLPHKILHPSQTKWLSPRIEHNMFILKNFRIMITNGDC
ncbi:hypothetical protein NQ318_007554 [Aromia moschata]|uniref:DUF4371 domain-containing protein n=1 Tax=Aromia moschata TaxID=1265417 RepID=A0AAV8YDR3_9CUCU|nr:hypothetical protein NQ318_007554 [Aromia moschata]